MHLVATCDGEVYFTRKKNKYNKQITKPPNYSIRREGPAVTAGRGQEIGTPEFEGL